VSLAAVMPPLVGHARQLGQGHDGRLGPGFVARPGRLLQHGEPPLQAVLVASWGEVGGLDLTRIAVLEDLLQLGQVLGVSSTSMVCSGGPPLTAASATTRPPSGRHQASRRWARRRVRARSETHSASGLAVSMASRTTRVEQVTLLREQAPLGRVRQELYRVETQAATLLGRLVWDVSGQRDHATAARYYNQAIAAASNVREGWAEAFPRMFQRFNPVSAGSTDLRTGLELAERASARALDGSSHVVAGWSLGFTAEAHALLGEERKTKLALDRADFQLSKVAADDPMFGVFAREQLGGFVGACHLHLRDPRGALVALQESARTLGAGKEKHKSVVLGDVSAALVLHGDPEQASAVLHQAIDLVELTGSAAGKRRVFAAGRRLRPWRNELFAQEVQDRLLALAC
jgi:hypothetical protein